MCSLRSSSEIIFNGVKIDEMMLTVNGTNHPHSRKEIDTDDVDSLKKIILNLVMIQNQTRTILSRELKISKNENNVLKRKKENDAAEDDAELEDEDFE